MAEDPFAHVTRLHNELLQILSSSTNMHFAGLQQGSRHHRHFPSSLRRRLCNLDICFNVMRHITAPFAAKMKSDIQAALMEPVQKIGHVRSSFIEGVSPTMRRTLARLPQRRPFSAASCLSTASVYAGSTR
eukprot:TRINITY_DN123831_c0_g1_i1.p1 TRINITY_DN123831_c0_g1~~TRINITY_DN123831_c0_g1_i1.p1  ORF type:complete len:152 (+),score=11.82 TRINITY_DN123831_c0_g1_i1:66-458(+)